MYSFQAKIDLKKMRKGENKNYRFVSLLPNGEIENSKKIEIKLKELKYTIMTSFQAKTGWKMPRREKIKIIGPFRSYTTRNRKFQKNSKKIKKIPLWLSFKPK